MQKNEIYETEITGMTGEGSGVCRIDGMAVFVPMTAVGDKLRVRIVKVLKQYAFGIIENLLEPSADRIEPECPCYAKCGGCVFSHLSYEAECRIKAEIVKDAFARLGHLEAKEVLPIFGAAADSGYRNKAQYPCGIHPVTGKPCFGFYAPRSHRLVPVTDCKLQPAGFGALLRLCEEALAEPAFRVLTPYQEESGNGVLRHLYLRQGYHSKEIMVCFVSAKDTPELRTAFTRLGQRMQAQCGNITSVMLNVNPQKTNVILGKKTVCLAGKPTIADTLCGVPVALSPQSFYQVNTAQAERLFTEAKRLTVVRERSDFPWQMRQGR